MSEIKNPNEILTEDVFLELAESGLVNKVASKDLLKQILAGTVKANDWRIALQATINESKEKSSDETSEPGN